ncbi:hypothetical protein GF337_12635, partial [candidate division KSB1 bacterium]|nr:hypothetical protein [candidate division KSB1 bacterium]
MDTDTQIQMVRPHLNDIPEYHVPEGYSMRWYQPGDEQSWFEIQRVA